jgi:hypothetical protein
MGIRSDPQRGTKSASLPITKVQGLPLPKEV